MTRPRIQCYSRRSNASPKLATDDRRLTLPLTDKDMASLTTDRDNRPRLIYKMYHGKKGPEFEPWVLGFLDAAEGISRGMRSWLGLSWLRVTKAWHA